MSNAKTIENLNKALKMEISATHQYQLHAHVLEGWGLVGLAAQMREEKTEETGHSDRFLERILFLKGEPEVAFNKPPVRAKTLREMLEADLKDEEEAIALYSQAARDAAEENDIGSRMLFEEIVLDEEGHKAWLELQLDLIDRLGEASYSLRFLEEADAQCHMTDRRPATALGTSSTASRPRAGLEAPKWWGSMSPLRAAASTSA